jgi:hypothetical protein
VVIFDILLREEVKALLWLLARGTGKTISILALLTGGGGLTAGNLRAKAAWSKEEFLD